MSRQRKELCARDMNMAEVRCQLWQQALHVCPLAIPGGQAMHFEGVPQIMKSRLVTASVMAQHARADTRPAEDVFRASRTRRLLRSATGRSEG